MLEVTDSCEFVLGDKKRRDISSRLLFWLRQIGAAYIPERELLSFLAVSATLATLGLLALGAVAAASLGGIGSLFNSLDGLDGSGLTFSLLGIVVVVTAGAEAKSCNRKGNNNLLHCV